MDVDSKELHASSVADLRRDQDEQLIGKLERSGSYRTAAQCYTDTSSTVREAVHFNWCTLAFEDERTETAFLSFFSAVRGAKMLSRVLLLNFLYMIYVTVETSTGGSGASSRTFVISVRGSYILLNVGVFIVSQVWSGFYERWVNWFSFALTLLTGAVIIVEGLIWNQIYSPFIVLLLVLYLMASCVLVRMRFVVATVLCWLVCGGYVVVLIAAKPDGDEENVWNRSEARRWTTWYGVLLSLFALTVMVLARKFELQSRYLFVLYQDAVEHNEESTTAHEGKNATHHLNRSLSDFNGEVDGGEGHLRRRRQDGLVSGLLRGQVVMGTLLANMATEPPKRVGGHAFDNLPKNSIMEAEELPEDIIVYDHIKTGYRVNYDLKMAVRSLLSWHNETINMWTEFVPMLVFLFGWVYVEETDPVVRNAEVADRLLVNVSLVLGLVVRPLTSGLAHMLHCTSASAFVFWWRADYISILLTSLSSGVVMGRFTFYCLGEQEFFFYMSIGALFLSVLVTVLTTSHSGLRHASFFLYIGFANVLPYVYQYVLVWRGVEDSSPPDSYMNMWTVVFVLFCVAMLIKASSTPESCCAPGTVDNFGASHQIWHVLINTGSGLSFFMYREYLQWRITGVPCTQ